MTMRSAWLSLLLVMLSLRALVPTGFMPDPDALATGSFSFAICDGHHAIPFDTAAVGTVAGLIGEAGHANTGNASRTVHDTPIAAHDHAPTAQLTPAEISAEHDLLQALEPNRREDASRAPPSSSPSSAPSSEHGDICPFSAVLYLAVAAFVAIALLRVLTGLCWYRVGFITFTCLIYLRAGSPLGPRAPPLTR